MCGYCNKYNLNSPIIPFGEEKIDFGLLKEPATLRCLICGVGEEWNLFLSSDLANNGGVLFQIPVAYCPVCGQKLDELYQQKKEG